MSHQDDSAKHKYDPRFDNETRLPTMSELELNQKRLDEIVRNADNKCGPVMILWAIAFCGAVIMIVVVALLKKKQSESG